jgi:hypothetical protein
MLRPLFASLILTTTALPVMAEDMRAELTKLGAAYENCVNKHDAACVAGLYAKDGIQINPNGVFTDIKTLYENNFKNGADQLSAVTIRNVIPISNDAAVDDGSSIVTYKTDKGDNPVKFLWSGYAVRENGEMKVKVLTVVLPTPEQPKEASAK